MLQNIFKNRTFILALLLIIFLDLSSFYASFFSKFNTIAFFVVVITAFLISLIKLEYGLYIVLAELFFGSKGHLFYFSFGEIAVSLRIALFAVIMGAWLIKLLTDKAFRASVAASLKKSEFTFYYVLLFVVIGGGILRGILNGNNLGNIFLDANGWLFFGLVFIFLTVIVSWGQIKNILQILAASLTVLGLKSLVLLEFFSHNVNSTTPLLYRWLSVHGLSEITGMTHNFYRIFSQAQIYSLAGFFIFLVLLIQNFRVQPTTGAILDSSTAKDIPQPLLSRRGVARRSPPPLRGGWGGFKRRVKLESSLIFSLGLIFSGLTVLISFSRSFWLGAIGASIALFWGLKCVFQYSWLRISKLAILLAIFAALEIGAVYVLISCPKPTGEAISFTALLEERLTRSGSEKASLSRFNLLPPLLEKVFSDPIMGSGFGTTVSYKSLDPRNIGENSNALYTTYAFEWGYLDMWLKIGLAGLAVYMFLIWKIWKTGWKIIKFQIPNSKFQIPNLVFGMLIGLVAILITHITSPYLNHPLGIGYILLCSAIFEVISRSRPVTEN